MMVIDFRCWWQTHYVGDFLSPTHLVSNIRHQHRCNLELAIHPVQVFPGKVNYDEFHIEDLSSLRIFQSFNRTFIEKNINDRICQELLQSVLTILYSDVGFYFAFVRHCLTFTSITTQNGL